MERLAQALGSKRHEVEGRRGRRAWKRRHRRGRLRGLRTVGLCRHGDDLSLRRGTRYRTEKQLREMAAEVLRIPIDDISMTPADSLVTPFEFGPVGSRGTYAIGSAVIRAAEDARKKLLEFAAPKLGVMPDELDTADGVVFVKSDPQKGIKWRAMGNDRTILGYGRFEPDFTMCNCMMSFVEVEVDTETGKVTLLKVVNATDVGQIIDPGGLWK